ncbi:Peptidyl-tRNA hydrolase [Frankliniella fusca]|uniref:Peptidyl-tRNA hydrolase n=1 Tax=Frankliniella fusca TaxID=407009 RepID=A0AAE1I0F1_9NEOP|nr:Peptidyl-tRNA hydrolase [Frankliniella fusca]
MGTMSPLSRAVDEPGAEPRLDSSESSRLMGAMACSIHASGAAPAAAAAPAPPSAASMVYGPWKKCCTCGCAPEDALYLVNGTACTCGKMRWASSGVSGGSSGVCVTAAAAATASSMETALGTGWLGAGDVRGGAAVLSSSARGVVDVEPRIDLKWCRMTDFLAGAGTAAADDEGREADVYAAGAGME